MENIIVYVKLDSNNVVLDINSSIFIENIEGWTPIAQGEGFKYSHAQNNYLEKSLIDYEGRFNYKLVGNEVIELTDEEKGSLFPTTTPEPTLEERNRADIDYILVMQGL